MAIECNKIIKAIFLLVLLNFYIICFFTHTHKKKHKKFKTNSLTWLKNEIISNLWSNKKRSKFLEIIRKIIFFFRDIAARFFCCCCCLHVLNNYTKILIKYYMKLRLTMFCFIFVVIISYLAITKLILYKWHVFM